MEILPVTRKEQFLKAAMDSEPLTIDAVTRIETYLSKISGADVTIPDPVTKIEMYLASIAGADVVLPDPVTRVEKYLAKLAGMDVLVPEPITRIEQFLSDWVNQPVGVLKTISGAVVFVSDALARAAKDISVKINPIQDLHGYSNPWPAGGGKNKFSIDAITGKKIYRANVQKMGDDVNSFYLAGATGTADNMRLLVTAWAYITVYTGILVTEETKVSVSCKLKNFTADCNGFVRICYNTTEERNGSTTANIIRFNSIGTTNISLTATIPAHNYVFLEFSPANKSSDITLEQYDEVTEFQLEIGASAPTSFAPYSNICPISGFTGVNIYHESAYDPDADPTYSISWQDEAGTVYGGTLDVTTGVLTVDRAIKTISGSEGYTWSKKTSSYGNLNYINADTIGLSGWKQVAGTNSKARSAYGVCNEFIPMQATTWGTEYKTNNTVSFTMSYDGYFGFNTGSALATSADVNTWLSEHPLQIAYLIETPFTIQLTPTEIEMLEGNNTLWADTGDITVTYMADGNANDVEALNILLGNRYVNLGEPDEATDREALDILLGGR